MDIIAVNSQYIRVFLLQVLFLEVPWMPWLHLVLPPRVTLMRVCDEFRPPRSSSARLLCSAPGPCVGPSFCCWRTSAAPVRATPRATPARASRGSPCETREERHCCRGTTIGLFPLIEAALALAPGVRGVGKGIRGASTLTAMPREPGRLSRQPQPV